MTEILFLEMEEVLEIHHDVIEEFGGSHGLRDENGLQSALKSAENRYHYEDADIVICAATYAFHLTKSHSFIDGNKRIASAAALIFLRLNDIKHHATTAELTELFLKIASGEMEREEVEDFFREKVNLS